MKPSCSEHYYSKYFIITIQRPLKSTLFPYTTLFRSGAAGNANLVLKSRAIAPNETYLCPELRSEEHTSELQSRRDIVCRLLHEKKNPSCLLVCQLFYNYKILQSHMVSKDLDQKYETFMFRTLLF